MFSFHRAFPDDPKIFIFSAATACMAATEDAMTSTRSFFGVFSACMYAPRTSVLTLNFRTPRSIQACKHRAHSPCHFTIKQLKAQLHPVGGADRVLRGESNVSVLLTMLMYY